MTHQTRGCYSESLVSSGCCCCASASASAFAASASAAVAAAAAVGIESSAGYSGCCKIGLCKFVAKLRAARGLRARRARVGSCL